MMPEQAKKAVSKLWRVGGKIPLNVYDPDDRPMFQCHTPEDAYRIVAQLNAHAEARRKIEELEAQLKSWKTCNTCGGASHPDGKTTCICDGTGSAAIELNNLRLRCVLAERENERLVAALQPTADALRTMVNRVEALRMTKGWPINGPEIAEPIGKAREALSLAKAALGEPTEGAPKNEH